MKSRTFITRLKLAFVLMLFVAWKFSYQPGSMQGLIHSLKHKVENNSTCEEKENRDKEEKSNPSVLLPFFSALTSVKI